MIEIFYPDRKPLIQSDKGKEYIFCIIRKEWFVLTPEEWVRQNFLLFLTDVMGFSPALIAVEKQIILSEVKKRFDIVVYNRDGQPFMVIECKEMNEVLSENVLHQALRYNSNLDAAYIIITNGVHCFGFQKVDRQIIEIHTFPKP